MSEPLERWGEDAPPSFRRAKDAYAELAPPAEQLERMLARVEAGAPASVRAQWWRRPKLWLSAISLLGALGVTLFSIARTVQLPPPVEARNTRTAVAAVAPALPEQAVQQRGAELPVAQEADHVLLDIPQPHPSAERGALHQRSAHPLAADPLAELALLERARRVMAKDPARALQLTEEHRRHYLSGQLAEERELLAIEALVKLGNTAQAERRGRAFERTHPNSVHIRRLGVILQRAAP
jgi:hypothetical protein